MKLRRRIRWLGESLLVCIALYTIPFLSRRAVVGLASRLGGLAFRCSGSLRRIGLANLELAFPEKTQEERSAIAVQSLRTFALTLIDMFWFSRFAEGRIRRYVRFDPSFQLYFDTKPGVMVTGHLGNWEVLGLAVALHGEPSVSVAMPVNNVFVDMVLNRLRRRTGQIVVQRQGAVREMTRALRDGGRVAMLLDQNTLPREGGVFVEFFGLPVPVSKAGAALASRTRSAIVVAHGTADLEGVYTAYARLPATEPGMDATQVTQALARTMEDVIREDPGQWLWTYKRWRYIPAGVGAERYPFYARACPDGNADRAQVRSTV